MFNSTLKNDALAIHQKAVDRYKDSHEKMLDESAKLYEARKQAVELTKKIEDFINTIANSPKEFEVKMGLVDDELKKFKETEEFANESLESEIKSGLQVGSAIAGGIAFTGMAPTVAMHIATTFGKASTGVAIKTLSGAAAQKAALAWLGGGALSAGGAGIAGGQALLALAGPVGWSITAASAGASLISMSRKNKKIAEEAIEEAKKIMKLKESMDETIEKIKDLCTKTKSLYENLAEQFEKGERLRDCNYVVLVEEDRLLLGAIVNNTLSLMALINEVIK